MKKMINKIEAKFWDFFIFKMMGVQFEADNLIRVTKPLGIFMFERESLFDVFVRVGDGQYKFKKHV